ncbi:MAG: tetratricopeptide repeat protein, partial [Planctomycetota bacterium]
MKGTGIVAWVAAATVTAAAGFAAEGDQGDGVAAGVMLPAVSATSPSGETRVTVVEGRANTPEPLTVRALIVQPGTLASWVLLPLTESPQELFVPDDESIVCVDRSLGAPCIVQMNLKGEELRSRSLASLLPASRNLAEVSSISLAFTEAGPSLAVQMDREGIALVSLGEPEGEALEVCSVVPNQGSTQDAEQWLRESRELLLAGDEAAARASLEAAREAFPAEPRVYQQLARIHRRAGDRAAQLDCLEEGLRRSHGAVREAVTLDWQVGTPEARLVLEFVETTRKVRGDREAGRVLGQALKLYPCMEQAVILRAELLLASGKGEEAIASLEEAVGALEGSGDVGAALHDIGRFLERQGRHEEALLFMERSFAKGEFSEFLIRDIADLHVRINQPTVAARWLSRLEDHWGSVANGATGLDRSLRGHRRLTDLRREIEELEGAGAVVTDP